MVHVMAKFDDEQITQLKEIFATREEMPLIIREEVRPIVQEVVREEVRPIVREIIREEVRPIVSEEVHNEVASQLEKALLPIHAKLDLLAETEREDTGVIAGDQVQLTKTIANHERRLKRLETRMA